MGAIGTGINKIGEMLERYGLRSLFKFGIVGCINTGVDFGVFTLLWDVLGVNYIISQAAGYTAGILNSFLMNKYWTFAAGNSKIHTSVQFVRFVAVNAISLGISLLGMKLLNTLPGMNMYVAKITVTVVVQAVNYLGYRLWVFRGVSRSREG